MIDERVLEIALKKAMSRGGDYADIFVESRKGFSVQYEDGKIEKISQGIDSGAGIRLIRGGHTFYGYTNDLTSESLYELANTVSRAVKHGEEAVTIAFTSLKPSVVSPIRIDPSEVAAERKVALTRKADEVARGYSDKIRQVLSIYRDSIQAVKIMTSRGDVAEDYRVYTLALVQVVASEDGEVQTGYEPVGGLIGFELFDETPIEAIAEAASKRAVTMLSARKAPGGRMPVVISSEAGGTMIHEAIGHGLEADLAGQGLSVYSGKVGQKVASDLITVVDDATIPNKRGSFSFDDEGVHAQKTVLVEKGILKGYMYDVLNALKEGKTSTGNGRRESYRHRPIPRMTNTLILPGEEDPQEIIRSVDKGLFVKKMGGGQVNTVNGDFVFEVQEGYLIDGGEIGEPVRGATLTGNGPAILNSIDMLGSDLGFSIGTCGKDGQGVPVSDAMPTVRIPDMVVGGEVV
ncbi:MAG TPA: TldD/PmbA family protein [Nitrospirae bacterium]|nr:TldD/PmbA family protein [Nitrospirota bacterium]